MNLLAYGEVLWDVFGNEEHMGGAPLNFGAHFVKCGGNSWIATSVGNDELGIKTLDEIKNLGFNADFVEKVDAQTGKCVVTLSDGGIPKYDLLDDVAYDYIKKPQSQIMFDVLYFGTLSLRNSNNRRVLKEIIAENKFRHIFSDVNIRAPFYSDETISIALENATIIKISDEELPVIAKSSSVACETVESFAKMLCRKHSNLEIVIITMGEKGSYVFDSVNNCEYKKAAQKVNVVSTVGAGDSFSASFMACYLKTASIEKALELATRVSAFVVSCTGAVPDYKI